MKGTRRVRIQNNRIRYDFPPRRNLTVAVCWCCVLALALSLVANSVQGVSPGIIFSDLAGAVC